MVIPQEKPTSSSVDLASRDIHLEKPRLKSVGIVGKQVHAEHISYSLASREEEGMMRGKADNHLPQ
jgi:hypothetical protein